MSARRAAASFIVALSLNDQFEQRAAWRQDFTAQLSQLQAWLDAHRLAEPAVAAQLQRLQDLIRSDKVVVTFVAEFSRGKSELINALFFADYGRRIMPASAGRTTMCPTELGYDPDTPPCLRLLPIQTRLEPVSLAGWRERPEGWTRVDLDLNDVEGLAQAFRKVEEVVRVSQIEARALGLWHDDAPDDNPMPDAQGMVEVPRWRHAWINLPHPLTQEGLVILDTPGLNAVGTEPELTVSLIPQAHAVVFILSADAGVTRSDLTMWREHLAPVGSSDALRLVVLNKIDTLWGALDTAEQVESQIEAQRLESARLLGIAPEQVLAVSAQKGLMAKMSGDAALLKASRLPALERQLSAGLLGRRSEVLRQAAFQGVERLRLETERVFAVRRRELAEQAVELKGLRGKNASVIDGMRRRIEQEQAEFDQIDARIQALKTVHRKLQGEALDTLSVQRLRLALQSLVLALRQPGLKLGARKAYASTFGELRQLIEKASAAHAQLQEQMAKSFRELNAVSGFSLQPPGPPDYAQSLADLDRLHDSHAHYLGVTNLLRLAQPEFSDRLVRALAIRLRALFEACVNEMQQWSQAAIAQMDLQVRERRRSFIRRLEAVDRIQNAASSLAERIVELEAQEQSLASQERDMRAMLAALAQAATLHAGESPASPSHE